MHLEQVFLGNLRGTLPVDCTVPQPFYVQIVNGVLQNDGSGETSVFYRSCALLQIEQLCVRSVVTLQKKNPLFLSPISVWSAVDVI